MTKMDDENMRKVLLVAFVLVSVSMQRVASHTQDLELALSRETTFLGSGDPCGELICRVKGNGVTIEFVSVSVTEASGESRQLLGVTSSIQDADVLNADVRGNGTLVDNLASIFLDLFESSVCVAGYFTCEVTYTKASGERKNQFASAGPGHPPSRQAAPELQPYKYPKPDDPYSSELCQLKDKVSEVRFQSLDARMNQMLETVNLADTSSRLSRLEDRVSTLLLAHSPSTGSTSPTDPSPPLALEDLESRVTALEASMGSAQSGDQPLECERGMGDDVSKWYRPYVKMTHREIQKEIICDTHTDGGGWILIQRRTQGDVDFKRDWTAYREGFGSVTGDFWLGNEAIHSLTDQHLYELRIDMRIDGQEAFSYASSFIVESEANSYRLRLGTISGTHGTVGLAFHNNMAFSTFDRDNDTYRENCALTHHHGGWWYGACIRINPNGIWGEKSTQGVSLYTGHTWIYPSFIELKIRRVKPNTVG